MAKISLPVRTLSRNEISTIAQLLEQSFDYHVKNNSPFYSDYLRSLRTLIGLGYTAVLADRDLLSIYQRYLNQFIEFKQGDFKEAPGAKTCIAQSTAEMVGTALVSFNALKLPRYYGDFFQALQYVLTKISRLTDNNQEAERILQGLSVRL